MRTALTLGLLTLIGCPSPDEGPDPVDHTDPPCVADADGDGWCAPDDCDDSRALTHPGAVEVPYNGVDDDCSGADLCDVDGDGHDKAVEACGGDDCNDGNPLVHPGAHEPCYPDHDYDCDGVQSADDCDLDGWPKSDDCDDEDASVYPGAPDAWYDGVDSDCAWDSDFDQDGDSDEVEWQAGWPDPSWPDRIPVWDPYWEDEPRIHYVPAPSGPEEWSGLDCADLDPRTGGALEEIWDGEDRDCDGVVDRLTTRDSAMAWDASGGDGDAAWGGAVALLGDLDGDGHAEVAAGDLAWGVYRGGVYVVPSGQADGKPSEVALATISSSTEGAVLGWSLDSAGDLDKDGLDELLVGAPLYETRGATFVFSGADLAAGGELTEEDALAELYDETYTNGLSLAAIGDLSGDKMSEIASGSGTYVAFYLGVWSGARAGYGGLLSSEEALAVIVDDTARGGDVGSGDFDGDGVVDVLASSVSFEELHGASGGTTYLFDGDAVRAGSAAALEDADATLPGTGCLGSTLGRLDDVDGDGYPEALVADACASGLDGEPHGGSVYVVDGDVLWAGGDVAEIAHYVVDSESGGTRLRVGRRGADHDGDGAPDLLVAAPGTPEVFGSLQGTFGASGTGSIHWFPSAAVASGGSTSLEEGAATFAGLNDGAALGLAWDVGDSDGDGDSDLYAGSPMVGAGKLHLFRNELP